MWIGKGAAETIDALRVQAGNWQADYAKALAEKNRLEIENARLRSDMDWFKLRLNQVERERGQLIQAAIGVKIAVPEFVPTYEDPGAALNDMPSLANVGNDALDQFTPKTEGDVDYSNMPGYEKQR